MIVYAPERKIIMDVSEISMIRSADDTTFKIGLAGKSGFHYLPKPMNREQADEILRALAKTIANCPLGSVLEIDSAYLVENTPARE